MTTPATPAPSSQTRLAAWLSRDNPGRLHRQAGLAEASGIPQQTLSAYLLGHARPDPHRAALIEAATLGFVRADGWATAKERREQAAAVRAAKARAARLQRAA